MTQPSNKKSNNSTVRFAFTMVGLAFAALIGATWYTVKIAMDGHEPVMDKNYYEKGLNYEKEIAESIQMKSEGYRFESSIMTAESGLTKEPTDIEIRIFKNETPVNNAKLFLTKGRTATNKFTEKKEIIFDKEGIYRGNLNFLHEGEWQITLNAKVENRSFEKTFMVLVK
ncbi:MAG: FixH family protein [Leptospiraceae bacterium]|nr:FixH family protein [Leptospiraceae bacterium]